MRASGETGTEPSPTSVSPYTVEDCEHDSLQHELWCVFRGVCVHMHVSGCALEPVCAHAEDSSLIHWLGARDSSWISVLVHVMYVMCINTYCSELT